MANEVPPSCAATFRRMLQGGPTNSIYAEGDKRVVRMPPAELSEWQNKIVKDGKEKLMDIPRPVYKLRVWDADNRRYTPVSAALEGAPLTDAGMDQWYVDWIKRLKSHMPGAWVDAMATSTRHATHSDISRGLGGVEPVDAGAFSNRWTKLCVATTTADGPGALS